MHRDGHRKGHSEIDGERERERGRERERQTGRQAEIERYCHSNTTTHICLPKRVLIPGITKSIHALMPVIK